MTEFNQTLAPATVAVVVTYNRKELLLQCIQCLLSQEGASCDVLIVDNASTDGTGEVIRSMEDPRIRYHSTGENLGGAGGFNAGMKVAFSQGYSHIWLMDDDTLPKPDALRELLAADRLAPSNYGYLSSVALWTDGTECKMNRQKLLKAFYTDAPLLREGMVRAEQATFVSLMIRAQTIRQVGLPISQFFIWGDDIEYTRRIAVRAGLPAYVVGRSQVIHAMKDNNGSAIATDMAERITRYRYAFRNENYTYRQEGFKGFAYYSAKCALNILRILRHAKGQRFRRCGIIISQYFGGLFFNPKIEFVKQAE